MSEKICTKCNLPKDEEKDFHKQRRKSGTVGRYPHCKECHKKLVYAWRDSHPEHKKYQAAWAKQDRDTHKPEYQAYEFSREMKKYGRDGDWYQQQLEAQGYVCAICGKPETAIDKKNNRVRRLAIDHNHSCCDTRAQGCGKCTRGLLCGKCNAALAALEDTPNWAEKAIAYLSKYELPTPIVDKSHQAQETQI